MLTISGFSSPSPCAKGSTFNPKSCRSWAAQARPAIGIALAMGLLAAGQAQAVAVNAGGQDWDVTTFTGTYNANTSKFATAANGGVMPWWGNYTIATEFASALQASLGSPNNNIGPFFGFYQVDTSTLLTCAWMTPASTAGCAGTGTDSAVTWAQATTTSAPGPLPFLGAAAAFGYSRKLRTRINRSAKIGSGTDCL